MPEGDDRIVGRTGRRGRDGGYVGIALQVRWVTRRQAHVALAPAGRSSWRTWGRAVGRDASCSYWPCQRAADGVAERAAWARWSGPKSVTSERLTVSSWPTAAAWAAISRRIAVSLAVASGVK